MEISLIRVRYLKRKGFLTKEIVTYAVCTVIQDGIVNHCVYRITQGKFEDEPQYYGCYFLNLNFVLNSSHLAGQNVFDNTTTTFIFK